MNEWDAAQLIQEAEETTGLSDWGDIPFRDGLEALVDSFNRESVTFGLRKGVAELEREDILRPLQQRLRLLNDRRKNGAIEDEKIIRPIFIVGMPRTGTTHVHRLLSLDPDSRSPAAWEIMFPSPPPESVNYDTDPRIEKAARFLAAVGMSDKHFAAMHSFGAKLPQECQHIFKYTFRSTSHSGWVQKPSFDRWLGQCDMKPAYLFHKMFLQNLQWHCPATRWVLKSPQHPLHIPELLSVYPDALVVLTHRDPRHVMPSLLSVMETLRGIGQITSDSAWEFEKWTTLLPKGYDAIEKLRAQSEYRNTFVDIQFDDLMADPVEEVAKVYNVAGIPFSTRMEQRISQFMLENPRGAKGLHHYNIEKYGFTNADIERCFHNYIQRYGARWG